MPGIFTVKMIPVHFDKLIIYKFTFSYVYNVLGICDIGSLYGNIILNT